MAYGLDILNDLLLKAHGKPEWDVLRHALKQERSIHLAIMADPFLSFILAGKKTVESRFSKHAIAPFRQIRKGDLVLMKKVGGPIVGCFTAGPVEFFEIDSAQLRNLRRRYSASICADDAFWKEREGKRYATLFSIREVRLLPSLAVTKRDRRGWIAL